MRLDKHLSQATELSRSQARRLIRAGKVSVDGATVREVDHTISGQSTVLCQGQSVSPAAPRYYMLNKPAGYVSATTDAGQPVVMDLLHENTHGLSVAGRLDKDTTGLVLISDDGAWVHAVISPRRDCTKVYQAGLDAPVDDTIIQRFAGGMLLRSETKPTLPAQLQTLSDRLVEVRIQEGRYHQVKRMFAACGRRVLTLHRTQVGGIVLDPSLAPGEYRALTDAEINGINV